MNQPKRRGNKIKQGERRDGCVGMEGNSRSARL